MRWPCKIDDKLRTILVRNGANNVVQYIDSKFKEVVRPESSAKEVSRKLIISWFCRTLSKGGGGQVAFKKELVTVTNYFAKKVT